MPKKVTIDDIQEITIIRDMLGVNAVWCHILFKGCKKPIPYYTCPTEEEDFQRDLYDRLRKGEYGEVIDGCGAVPQYITIPPNTRQLEEAAIEKRNQLLLESDWTEFPSRQATMSDAQKTAWANYRQALRDLTKQPGFPWDPEWPTKP